MEKVPLQGVQHPVGGRHYFKFKKVVGWGLGGGRNFVLSKACLCVLKPVTRFRHTRAGSYHTQ